MADSNRPSHGTGKASAFYMACREGNLDMVNRLLKSMTVRDVNRVEESNRSTALHAASFFGQKHVVQRLLEIGADTYIHNGHGVTPEQEAKTEDIRALFEEHKKKKQN